MIKRKFVNVILIILLCVIGFNLTRKESGKISEAQLRPTLQDKIVNVYSSEEEASMKELFDNFTKETGIEVYIVKDNAAKLVSRLEYEGINSPADVLITSDIANLYDAKQKGLLQSIRKREIKIAIPDEFKDDELQWIGFAKKVRAIFYNKDRVSPDQLSTYEDLADPKWKGKILIKSSRDIYNSSLVASFLLSNGLEKTEKWLKGFVANFAREPQGDDMDQLRELAKGNADIAIANSYYYGKLLASDRSEDKLVIAKVGIFFPDQDSRGAHINLSGGGLTVSSMNRDNGIKLLEYLAGKDAQEIYSNVHYEYPVLDNVKIPSGIAELGDFKQDKESLKKFPELLHDASYLAVKHGWH